MKLIRLPVVWHESNAQRKQLIEIGVDASHIDESQELGEAYINPEYVSHVNVYKEFTNVWINEQVFKIPLPVEEVLEKLRA